MKTKHTQGKWTICSYRGECYPGVDAIGGKAGNFSVIVMGNGDDLCGIQGRTEDEIKANAKLIAAAPELLKVLIVADDLLRLMCDRNGDVYKGSLAEIDIVKAIKKATE